MLGKTKLITLLPSVSLAVKTCFISELGPCNIVQINGAIDFQVYRMI